MKSEMKLSGKRYLVCRVVTPLDCDESYDVPCFICDDLATAQAAVDRILDFAEKLFNRLNAKVIDDSYNAYGVASARWSELLASAHDWPFGISLKYAVGYTSQFDRGCVAIRELPVMITN